MPRIDIMWTTIDPTDPHEPTLTWARDLIE